MNDVLVGGVRVGVLVGGVRVGGRRVEMGKVCGLVVGGVGGRALNVNGVASPGTASRPPSDPQQAERSCLLLQPPLPDTQFCGTGAADASARDRAAIAKWTAQEHIGAQLEPHKYLVSCEAIRNPRLQPSIARQR